jgi:ribose transport system permease protein
MLVGVVLAVGLILHVTNRHFFTGENLDTILTGLVPDAIIAIGMTVLIASGSFDLSVGSVLALSGVATGTVLVATGNISLGILAGLATGLACGLVNGLVVTFAGVNPLIATLGMMMMARSLALVKTQSIPISGFPPTFALLGQGRFGGHVSLSIVLMVWLILSADQFMRYSAFCRQVYYIGGNPQAAFLSGIPVRRLRLFTFLFSGFLAAFAGIMVASRLMTAPPTVGVLIELRVIAAVVIGGASLAGGEGTILGAFLGVLLMGLIGNGLTLWHVSPYWQDGVTGSILVLAVSLDMLMKRRRGR